MLLTDTEELNMKIMWTYFRKFEFDELDFNHHVKFLFSGIQPILESLPSSAEPDTSVKQFTWIYPFT